ncbi:MAG: hypothetical protein V7711_13885 [Pseudomonadales bacterium]
MTQQPTFNSIKSLADLIDMQRVISRLASIKCSNDLLLQVVPANGSHLDSVVIETRADGRRLNLQPSQVKDDLWIITASNGNAVIWQSQLDTTQDQWQQKLDKTLSNFKSSGQRLKKPVFRFQRWLQSFNSAAGEEHIDRKAA